MSNKKQSQRQQQQGYPIPAVTPVQPTYPYGFYAPSGSVIGAPPSAQPSGTSGQAVPGMLPLEESYVENILRLNKGKLATVYMTFENNPEWPAKVFRGVIEAAGRDHLILSDPQTGRRYLLLMVFLNYVTFDEEIVYTSPQSLASYPPR
ncbi:spore coat protein GerQ [Aeribacillus sp. FSL K6-1305]|uniref:spore coat protein GerQ n=1 Tax=Aeribacillus sp. FSL K6-1305 TaxID=2954569 RepID=UPI0030FD78BD